MEQRRLGTEGPEVGAIAFGAMSFAGYYGSAEDAEGVRTVQRALDHVPPARRPEKNFCSRDAPATRFGLSVARARDPRP